MLYTFMLKLSKKELDKSLNNKDGYILTYRLINFINIAFSIREKFINNDRNDTFLGLKRFYNIIKHDYSAIDIIESITVTDGVEVEQPIFMDISNIKCLSTAKKYSPNQLEKYNKFIKGKSIKEITNKLYNDTMEVLKNNNYI